MELEKFKNDYDWRNAFNVAFGKKHKWDDEADTDNPIHDVLEIIAYEIGENEGKDWIGIFKMCDGKYVVLSAGCDYTGWECVGNSGRHETFDTLEAALSPLSLTREFRDRLGPQLEKFVARDNLKPN